MKCEGSSVFLCTLAFLCFSISMFVGFFVSRMSANVVVHG